FFTGQAPFVAYSTVAIMGAITYVFAGHMREQVCIYMCPWPRIQGAMVDEDTLIVTYNDWRGEPRGSKRDRKKHPEIEYGDCIDCGWCVQVCPTGIDIREGQQLACITCALCIDACNNVMDKIGRPQGLISYSNVNTYNAHVTGQAVNFTWRSFIRPRTIVYLTLWTLIAIALILHLTFRDRLQINVVHDRNPLYVTLSNGEIRNGYELRLLNMDLEPRTFRVTLQGLEGARMSIVGFDRPPARSFEVPVPGNKARTLRVYVTADPKNLGSAHEAFHFRIEALDKDGRPKESAHKKAIFESPPK
ncbi:MAG TPA: 4Fe-4S dicluster domain-containing protein, partial [Thermopetrobacter sp.]|nr:4Fe-4S dicluster domain-containing protein [Thermopetrobacter sp.]